MKVANVYQGIDLIFYNNGDDLEYDFAVAPRANPEQIQMAFEGTKEMRVDPLSGDLIVKLPGGAEVRQLKPKVYQQVGDEPSSNSNDSGTISLPTARADLRFSFRPIDGEAVREGSTS